jgi:hypothetical protein
MTYNAGMQEIAVDPAYTSRWGAQHWLALSSSMILNLPVITRLRW